MAGLQQLPQVQDLPDGPLLLLRFGEVKGNFGEKRGSGGAPSAEPEKSASPRPQNPRFWGDFEGRNTRFGLSEAGLRDVRQVKGGVPMEFGGVLRNLGVAKEWGSPQGLHLKTQPPQIPKSRRFGESQGADTRKKGVGGSRLLLELGVPLDFWGSLWNGGSPQGFYPPKISPPKSLNPGRCCFIRLFGGA